MTYIMTKHIITMGMESICRNSTAKMFVAIVFIITVNCTNNGNDACPCTTLDRFAITDSTLSHIINDIYELYDHIGQADKIIVLELNTQNDLYYFSFSLQEKEKISEKYIFRDNKRVVGYVKNRNAVILILTNINSRENFIELYSHLLMPLKETRKFEYISYSNSHYFYNDNSKAITWYNNGQMYEPDYIVYTYNVKEMKMSKPMLTKNIIP